MRFPISWLKEIIPTEQNQDEICRKLTLIGLEVEGVEKKEGETLIEVGITPNLSYAANMVGIGRELSAISGESIVFPPISYKEGEKAPLEVLLEKEDEAPRYAALVADVSLTPSPKWLANRLEMSKIRSKNALVDITNYVMLELGAPLHVFDYDKIEGKIIVRRARAGEMIKTLDGKEVFLTEEILVIADEKAPLAIAGVMGGVKAEIDESTKKIVIEAAYFDPKAIRRSSKRLGIKTESSWRFERGCDPNILTTALKRAATLLQEATGVKNICKIYEKSVKQFPPKQIKCRVKRVNTVLGTNLAFNEVETIFKRVGFQIKEGKNDVLEVIVPTYRNDVKEEIDLVEEVARFYGYDNIYHKNQNVSYQGSIIPSHPFFPYLRKIREAMINDQFLEVATCNLISLPEAGYLSPDIFLPKDLVKLLNPTSQAHLVMRPSLFPNMMQVANENFNHGHFSLRVFEVGKIHFKVKERFVEPTSLALLISGKNAPYNWQDKPREVDFFDMKGAVENLALSLKMGPLLFSPSHFSHFHPGRQAEIVLNGHKIGVIGEVHPHFLTTIGIETPLFFAELNLDDLFPTLKGGQVMKPLPLFPSSSRDLTLTLKKEVPFSEILSKVNEKRPKILEEVLLLDVYESDKLGSSLKNITLRFTYRDLEKTVSFEEVEKEHEEIANILKRCGV